MSSAAPSGDFDPEQLKMARHVSHLILGVVVWLVAVVVLSALFAVDAKELSWIWWLLAACPGIAAYLALAKPSVSYFLKNKRA